MDSPKKSIFITGKMSNNSDRSALFDNLFRKHYAPVVMFVDSYLHNRARAEDIAQNTFVILWEKLNTLDESLSVKSYIFTIAKNLTLDSLKHQKVKQNFLDTQLSHYKGLEEELNEQSLAVFDTDDLEKKLLIKKIKYLVMKLPFSDRTIFVMSKYNNLTNREIADILGVSIKTVEKRITISLKFLRKNFIIFIIIS